MLNLTLPIFAQATGTGGAAPATSGGTSSSGAGGMIQTVIFFAALFAIVYFLMIRPQKKKDQQHKDMLSKIQKGDRVVTIGGLHGEVESVKDDYVILLVNRESGHTLKFRRGAIHEILPKDSGSAEETK